MVGPVRCARRNSQVRVLASKELPQKPGRARISDLHRQSVNDFTKRKPCCLSGGERNQLAGGSHHAVLVDASQRESGFRQARPRSNESVTSGSTSSDAQNPMGLIAESATERGRRDPEHLSQLRGCEDTGAKPLRNVTNYAKIISHLQYLYNK